VVSEDITAIKENDRIKSETLEVKTNNQLIASKNKSMSGLYHTIYFRAHCCSHAVCSQAMRLRSRAEGFITYSDALLTLFGDVAHQRSIHVVTCYSGRGSHLSVGKDLMLKKA